MIRIKADLGILGKHDIKINYPSEIETDAYTEDMELAKHFYNRLSEDRKKQLLNEIEETTIKYDIW